MNWKVASAVTFLHVVSNRTCVYGTSSESILFTFENSQSCPPRLKSTDDQLIFHSHGSLSPTDRQPMFLGWSPAQNQWQPNQLVSLEENKLVPVNCNHTRSPVNPNFNPAALLFC